MELNLNCPVLSFRCRYWTCSWFWCPGVDWTSLRLVWLYQVFSPDWRCVSCPGWGAPLSYSSLFSWREPHLSNYKMVHFFFYFLRAFKVAGIFCGIMFFAFVWQPFSALKWAEMITSVHFLFTASLFFFFLILSRSVHNFFTLLLKTMISPTRFCVVISCCNWLLSNFDSLHFSDQNNCRKALNDLSIIETSTPLQTTEKLIFVFFLKQRSNRWFIWLS